MSVNVVYSGSIQKQLFEGFTNNSDRYGMKYLFPKNTYCSYEENHFNTIENVNMIIDDDNYREETVKRAVNYIRKKHSNEKRIGGSPTLMINGVTYRGARTAEGYKQAICSAFEEVPEEYARGSDTQDQEQRKIVTGQGNVA